MVFKNLLSQEQSVLESDLKHGGGMVKSWFKDNK